MLANIHSFFFFFFFYCCCCRWGSKDPACGLFFYLKFYLFLNRDNFLEHFTGHRKIEVEGTEIFHIPQAPHTTAFSIIYMTHQSSTFVAIDEPILTHHHHPKCLVYMRVHSWCCIDTFFGFEQMYNDMYPSSSIREKISTTLKIICASPVHPSFPQPLAITDLFFFFHISSTDLFYCLHSLAFSKMSYSWKHTMCKLFRLASFT